jgi:nitrogen fixation-related uncharacterized protein
MNSEYSYDYDYDDVQLEGSRVRGVLAFLFVFVIIAAVVVAGVFFWQGVSKDDEPNKQVVIEDEEDEDSNLKPNDDVEEEIEEEFESKFYDGGEYVVEIPKGWQVVKPSPAFRVLSIMKGSNRIEIFKLSDFDGNREFNFTGEETAEEVDSNVPKEFLTIGTGVNQYNVWLFYLTDDEEGKDMLHDIYDSIEVTSMGELG